mmetsp:Transcript_56476/g.76989  ORF Transcript_56476/g.76989 Transcript_56476/m.76989 type:complete len:224 (-) Transcript_56476:117-788(-)
MVAAFESAGYDVGFRIVNGRFWVPQNRERVYIVGTRSDLGCDEVQWDWYDAVEDAGDDDKTVRSILEPAGSPAVAECELSSNQWAKTQGVHAGNGFERARIDIDGKAPTLISSYRNIGSKTTKFIFEEADGTRRNGGSADASVLLPRFLTPRECCRLMGFPEHFPVPSVEVDGDASVSHFYQAIGNAVIPPVVTSIGTELIGCLQRGRIGAMGEHELQKTAES